MTTRFASGIISTDVLLVSGGTAKGFVFLPLEDEAGLLNIILRPQVYQQHRYTVRTESLLVIDGVVQKREGITNLIAEGRHTV